VLAVATTICAAPYWALSPIPGAVNLAGWVSCQLTSGGYKPFSRPIARVGLLVLMFMSALMLVSAVIGVPVKNHDRLEAEFLFAGISVILIASEAVGFLESKSQTKG
jgi:hypothetical protein